MNAVPSSSSWTSPDQPVLVAVDGHADDLEAAAWAAAEAPPRRTSLTVLHVYRWPLADGGSPVASIIQTSQPTSCFDKTR